MKQLKLTFLLTVLMSMVGATISAHDFAVANADGVTIYYVKKSYTEVTVSCRGEAYYNYSNEYTGNVVIPESVTYNGTTYNVTSIGAYAFRDCSGLASVTIGNSVTTIGYGAFIACSGLKKVIVSDIAAWCGISFGNSSANPLSYANHIYSNEDTEITDLVIPNGVTSIGNSAFYGCSSLTSITIPNSVTRIGDSAFYGCSGLTSITIPNSVTRIGDNAFSNTAWYNNQPNGLVYAGKVAYKYKGTMPDNTSITIEVGTLVIADNAFSSFTGLTSVTIPNSVTSIGGYAFGNCSSLTSVTIPNSVTSISEGTFYNCSGLTSVTIGNSVTSIGNEAFYNCSGLTSITIPNSVTSISEGTFYGCSGLTSVTIGNSVTSIGNEAFYNCSGLTSITIPNSVTSIGDKAYYNTRLKSVTIGSGVLSIGNFAFEYNYLSTPKGNHPVKVVWLTNTPPTGYSYVAGMVNYVSNDSYTGLSNKKVYSFLSSMFEVDGIKYVPVSPSERTCDAIDCTYNESAENINIGKTVSYQGINLTVKDVNQYVFYQNVFIKEVNLSFEGNLGDYAFQDCTDITKVVVKNAGNVGVSAFSGITGEFTANINNEGFIGSEAFYNSTGLKTLDVGTNVTDIGFGAFIGCTRLETVKLQNQGAIGHNAFQNCTAMTAATLGKKITSIGQYAFSNCSALEKIVIPNAVKTLGDYAFSGCSSMASAKIGTSVITIGSGAFSGCSALPQIVIPQSVTTINDYVFKGCSSLTNVNMEERKSDKTVLTLGSNDSNPLFADCPLDEVYIGRNISYSTEGYRGYSPFYRNTSLRSVTITDRETEISMNEFYGCTNLQDVTIGDGVESFGDWAFSGCSSLKHFSFGMNVEKIGREAFSDCTSMESIFSRSPEPPVCGDQALDDINKWICILTVPAGNKAAYMAADQWKDFFYIEEGDAVKKYFDISIEANEGGRVLVNDKEESKVSMKKGSDVVLRFTPEEGHTLKQVLVNGEDVTSQVVDGCYTLTEISADMTIKVVFSDTSGISTIKADDEDVKWYTLDGHRIDAPRKGLNIVRMSNGKTKKVLVK